MFDIKKYTPVSSCLFIHLFKEKIPRNSLGISVCAESWVPKEESLKLKLKLSSVNYDLISDWLTSNVIVYDVEYKICQQIMPKAPIWIDR